MLNAARSRIVSLAVASVAFAFARALESPVLGAIAVLLATVGVVTGPKFRAERDVEVGACLVALATGVLLPRALVVPTSSGDVLSARALLFTAPALFVAIARTAFATPIGGSALTLGIALVALTGAGRVQTPAYPPAVATFACLGLAGLAATDRARAFARDQALRHVTGILAGVGIAAAIAWSMIAGLPRLHDALIDRISERWTARAGFSSTMSLDALDGLLRSERVVLRLRNTPLLDRIYARTHPPLLRGAVLSRYGGGTWQEANADTPRAALTTPTTPLEGDDVVELEFPRAPDRYFLPIEASSVRFSTGNAYENDVGVRLPSTPPHAKRVWYRHEASAAPRGPVAADTGVPQRIAESLRARAAEFAPNGSSRERLALLQRALRQRYRYSLNFERTAGVDPVVDFLDTHPEGHCEYFASALTLLARSIGIPTRVVTGFRVLERSPLGGYFIVREHDAHAWVEAYVDGAWETLDPTPPDARGVDASKTAFTSALGDWFATAWEKVDDALARRSPFELSVLLVGLLGVLFVLRIVRARRKREPHSITHRDEPLPSFERLERELARRGFPRIESETLERFAARLALQAPAPLSEAEPLIHRYAAYRYGGVGEESALVHSIDVFTGRLTGPNP